MTIPATTASDPQHFYLNLPLYEEVAIPNGADQQATDLVYYRGPMDAFCSGCNTHSIFVRYIQGTLGPVAWMNNRRSDVTFHCSRNAGHQLHFVLQIDKESRKIQKIGQYPSLATLSMYDVRKYAGILAPPTFRELTKAIGLAAHGVGVGSFVYVRRIFEGLVEDAYTQAAAEPGWNELTYSNARMSERIQLLAKFLPAFLVQNKLMYGILSKGIHELSEAECLAAFPVVKIGIEIILDEKLRVESERKKLESARLAIQTLASQDGGK